MPNAHSLYLGGWGATGILLGCLTGASGADGQTPVVHPHDLVAAGPDAVIELLETMRPSRLTAQEMEEILRMLPSNGEVTQLGAVAKRKVDVVRQFLAATHRGWYEVKVINVPQAVVALHARAVVLISESAIQLLSAQELQALTAHEIGHEYWWSEWTGAHERADYDRRKELELMSDAIAVITRHALGMNPSTLTDAVERVTKSNRQRFGTAANERSYPTVQERRTFAREINRWLQDGS